MEKEGKVPPNQWFCFSDLLSEYFDCVLGKHQTLLSSLAKANAPYVKSSIN